jgi:hypothetical protein
MAILDAAFAQAFARFGMMGVAKRRRMAHTVVVKSGNNARKVP